MAPFRWPLFMHDLMLAQEVAAHKPSGKAEWEEIAQMLSEEFSKEGKNVILKGRGCREHIERLLEKYRDKDKKALKRSGTEEDYNELCQLLEDISTYRRDVEEQKIKEKEHKKNKEKSDKQKGLQMRAAALSTMKKRKLDDQECSSSDTDESDEDDIDDGDGGDDEDDSSSTGKKAPKVKTGPRKRTSRLSAIEMLGNKYSKKADYREKELDLRRQEFELQKKKYEDERAEREEKFKLELEERRMFLSVLKDKL